MSQNKQSLEEDQQIESKQYRCFCTKTYSSYAGLYLHLKSKHQDAFSKYKNMKISKLLIPVQSQTRKQIFRLKQPPKEGQQAKKKNSQHPENQIPQEKKQHQKQKRQNQNTIYNYPSQNNLTLFSGPYHNMNIQPYQMQQLHYYPNPVSMYGVPVSASQKFKNNETYPFQNYEHFIKMNPIYQPNLYDFNQNSLINGASYGNNIQMHPNVYFFNPQAVDFSRQGLKVSNNQPFINQNTKSNLNQIKVEKQKKQLRQQQIKSTLSPAYSGNQEYIKKMYESFINQQQSPTRSNENNISF